MNGRTGSKVVANTFQDSTSDIDTRFAGAKENATNNFAGAKVDLQDLLGNQRDSVLSDFSAKKEGNRGVALSTLPSNLRNSGVGQSAIMQSDQATNSNEASVMRGITQSGINANQTLNQQELSTMLGLDQSSIQAFMNEMQSTRAANAGVAGAKLSADTAASTGGTFGKGGFMGLGI